MYSCYAAFFEDISTVQYLPVDGLWSHDVTSLHQTKLRKWCHISFYICVLILIFKGN